jgi:hypothetical protein
MKNKNKCPEGQRYCPISKKCIPDDDNKGKGRRQGKGQGKGPIGVPYKNKLEEAIELVDIILSKNISLYEAYKKSDKIINKIKDNLNKMEKEEKETENKKEEETENKKEEEKEENNKSIEEQMKHTVQLLVTEESYRNFFKNKLKKWNIKSPAELNKEDKKKFFDEVDKEWNAKEETD